MEEFGILLGQHFVNTYSVVIFIFSLGKDLWLICGIYILWMHTWWYLHFLLHVMMHTYIRLYTYLSIDLSLSFSPSLSLSLFVTSESIIYNKKRFKLQSVVLQGNSLSRKGEERWRKEMSGASSIKSGKSLIVDEYTPRSTPSLTFSRCWYLTVSLLKFLF